VHAEEVINGDTPQYPVLQSQPPEELGEAYKDMHVSQLSDEEHVAHSAPQAMQAFAVISGAVPQYALWHLQP
jgi:hypothetical protein